VVVGAVVGVVVVGGVVGLVVGWVEPAAAKGSAAPRGWAAARGWAVANDSAPAIAGHQATMAITATTAAMARLPRRPIGDVALGGCAGGRCCEEGERMTVNL
jgi:hypothetical protein